MEDTSPDDPAETNRVSLGEPTRDESGIVAEDTTAMEPGEMVGRYVVLNKIGAGGMGVVYTAYDPELDRKLAVKLLLDGSPDRAARKRLIMEARALAKLNHPNVVTVHDVGTFREHVFLAMEYIDGWNVREWLDEQKPGWRQVLDVYLQAGRGLAAAHGAKIIHRDFKPDNVLVAKLGRVRVTDFGVARVAARDSDTGAHPTVAAIKEMIDETTTMITNAGAVPGTPGFIAPEQYVGAEADARGDQFSFCAALYEGLYGQRPFKGETYAAIAFQVMQGRVQDAPRDSRVPGWVRKVLLRGLSQEAAQRFPSMEALLAELSKNPGARRRRIALGVVTVGVLGGGAWALQHSADQTQSMCRNAGQKLAGIWDEDRRGQVQRTFTDTEAPFAEDAWTGVSGVLNEYARDWSAMYTEACEATHVHGEQSEKMLDLRMRCLERRRSELDATVKVFVAADEEVVKRAVMAARSLPTLERCADLEALDAAVPPPEDPAALAEVERIEAELARVRSLNLAGRYAEGLEVASPAVDAAEKLGFEPLRAEAELELALMQERAGKLAESEAALRRAIEAGSRGHHAEVLARAWSWLTFVVGSRQSRPDEAFHFLPAAEAAVVWAGDPATLRATLEGHRGSVQVQAGRYDEAIRSYELALELTEAEVGAGHLALAQHHSNLGGAHYRRGNMQKAQENWEKAAEIWRTSLGSDHPTLGGILANIGLVASGVGDHARAEAAFRDALRINEAVLGPEHSNVGTTLNNLATLYLDQGRPEEARKVLEKALPIYEKAYGKTHAKVAFPLTNLGTTLTRLEDYEAARDHLTRALQIREVALGKEHPQVAFPLTELGRLELAREEPRAALPHLRRALKIRDAQSGAAEDRADTAFVLAQVNWALGGRREQALELARSARDAFREGGGPYAKELGEVERWLAEQESP